jgi:hypothetical protein
MDIIQMECMPGSSTALKITNAAAEGRIWLHNGELIDAETAAGATGEEAFKNILGWKSGNFETLPPDPTRQRRITTSYQRLLLATAQTVDEIRSDEFPADKIAQGGAPSSPLAALGRHKGVEFLVVMDAGTGKPSEHWACENPEQIATWADKTVKALRALENQWHKVFGDWQTLLGQLKVRHRTLSQSGGFFGKLFGKK